MWCFGVARAAQCLDWPGITLVHFRVTGKYSAISMEANKRKLEMAKLYAELCKNFKSDWQKTDFRLCILLLPEISGLRDRYRHVDLETRLAAEGIILRKKPHHGEGCEAEEA